MHRGNEGGLVDWIAGITEFIAIVAVGEKSKWGWFIGIICCLMWTAYVLISWGSWGILIPTIPSIIINIRYFIKWSKEERKEKEQ